MLKEYFAWRNALSFHETLTGLCGMQDAQLQLHQSSSAVQFVTVAGWLMSVIPLQRLFDADDHMVDEDDDVSESMPSSSNQPSGLFCHYIPATARMLSYNCHNGYWQLSLTILGAWCSQKCSI